MIYNIIIIHEIRHELYKINGFMYMYMYKL